MSRYLLLAALVLARDVVAAPVDFRRDVLPLLEARCFECHRGREASSGHRLDARPELLGESTGETLVVPGRAADSRLIARVSTRDPDQRMPPKGAPLSDAEVALLKRWIDEGVAWDTTLLPDVPPTDHWAFRPPQRPSLPHTAAAAPHPVDRFLDAELARHGLVAAEPASRRTLARRLALDLLGVPPEPAEVEAFVADPAPDAYERLVDRWLASPRYGQRWGRHWLDIARWSESEGYESNHPRPFAWRYRDYVVDSFNRDRPYDEFLTQQLAGDELVAADASLDERVDEPLIATGFLAAARLSSNEEDKWLQRNQVLVDVVNATGTAVLGLTLACAQCHNHKFDPLTIRDYYRLLGYFLPGQPVNVALADRRLRADYERRRSPEHEPAAALRDAIFEQARARMIADARRKLSPESLRALDTPLDQRTPAQERLAREADLEFQSTPNGIERFVPADDRPLYDALKKKLAGFDRDLVVPQTWAYVSPVTSPRPRTVLPSVGFYPLPYDPEHLARLRPYLHLRGDVHAIGPRLTAGTPAVFASALPPPDAGPSRRVLAAWFTDRHHPLTARVWVNRLWQFHFGRGLVATADDFGVRGAAPSHPALLDWLACELVDSGWSTKHVQRLLLTSAVYCRSSTPRAENASRDEENRFLAHFPPQRLEAETLRDTLLAITGELDDRPNGPSVPLDHVAASSRRSLYLFQRRGQPPEMQRLFDGPNEASESCPQRNVSTSPLQSLFLLNDRFTWDRARRLAERLAAEEPSPDARLRAAFVRVLGREPDPEELAAAREFVADSATAWPRFCHALLITNELAYRE